MASSKAQNIELLVSTRYDGSGMKRAERDIERITTRGSATRQEAASFARGTRRAENAVYAREASLGGQIRREAERLGRNSYGGGFAGSVGRSGGSMGGSGGSSSDSLYRDLKQVGLFAAATKVAAALGRLPEVVDSWRAAVKAGESGFNATRVALEESIPVIGQFMKAGRAIREVIDDAINPSKRKAQEAKDRQAETAAMRESRDQRRAAVLSEGNDALRQSRMSSATAGMTGYDREFTEAGMARAEQLRLLSLDQEKKGGLSPAQAEQYQKQLNERRANIESEYQQKVAGMVRRERENEEKLDRDHKNTMLESAERFATQDLENQGMHLTARLKAIDDAFEQEKRAAEKAYYEDGLRIQEEGGNYSAKTEASRKRYDDAIANAERSRMSQRGGALGFGNQDRLRGLESGLDERMAAFGKESLRVETEKKRIEAERLQTIREITDQERAGAIDKAKSLELQGKANELAKAQADEVARLARYAKLDRERGVASTLAGFRNDELQKLASRTGNAQYSQAAEREALKQEYENRAIELQKIIDDPKTTEQHRAAARTWLDSLDNSLTESLKDIKRSKVSPSEVIQGIFSPTQEAQGITGVGMSIRESMYGGKTAEEKIADDTGAIREGFKKFLELLTKNPGGPPPALFGAK